MPSLEWMAWTPPVAIFFASIFALLLAMTIWEIRSPTIPRKGLLPLVTTRGDRLFVGLLAAALLNLALAGLTDLPQGYGAIAGVIAVVLILRWG